LGRPKVIVNRSCKFIFVHIPKCAGTTLSQELGRFTSYCDLELGGTAFGEKLAPLYKERFGLRKHSTASEIVALVGQKYWGACFTFAFVRDPFARAYSVYKFLRQWKRWEGRSEIQALPDFRAFVASSFFEGDGPDRIMKPQCYWVQDSAGDLLTDFVGRVEQLEADLGHVLARLGLERSPEPLATRNRTAHSVQWIAAYSDPDTVQRVARKYQADFETFGYEPCLPSSSSTG
jgi:hypothetical protein